MVRCLKLSSCLLVFVWWLCSSRLYTASLLHIEWYIREQFRDSLSKHLITCTPLLYSLLWLVGCEAVSCVCTFCRRASTLGVSEVDGICEVIEEYRQQAQETAVQHHYLDKTTKESSIDIQTTINHRFTSGNTPQTRSRPQTEIAQTWPGYPSQQIDLSRR